jgi:hypothetical protein
MAGRVRPGLEQEVLPPSELRKFAWILAALILLFGAIVLPWRWDLDSRPVSIGIAAILAAWGGLAPATLRGVYSGWLTLGHALGWVNSRIILALLFFGIVTPTALILKLLGKDPMKRKLGTTAGSYRTERGEMLPTDYMERPY